MLFIGQDKTEEDCGAEDVSQKSSMSSYMSSFCRIAWFLKVVRRQPVARDSVPVSGVGRWSLPTGVEDAGLLCSDGAPGDSRNFLDLEAEGIAWWERKQRS